MLLKLNLFFFLFLLQSCLLEPSPEDVTIVPAEPLSISRNMTNDELKNFFSDQFDTNTEFIFSRAPRENSLEGSKNLQSPDSMTDGRARFLHQNSLLLANEIVKNNPSYEEEFTSCLDASTCLTDEASLIQRLAFTFYRRKIDEFEKRTIESLISNSQGLVPNDLLKVILGFFIQSPQFHLLTHTNDQDSQDHLREYITNVSLFLWKSPPSVDLLKRSESIKSSSQLNEFLSQMIDDPKTIRGIRSFYSEWLGLAPLDSMVKNKDVFQVLSPEVFLDAKEEVLLTLEMMWREGLDIRKLLYNDHTYINDRLGKIYGIEIVGNEFRRVEITNLPNRTGLLTSVAFSSLLSKSIYSSPTSRGMYVIKKLFCEDVPPPPPGLGAFLPDTIDQPVSRKEKMYSHASSESCSGCHILMDPIGLGLENFNAIGEFRSDYTRFNHILPLGNRPIDISSQLRSNGEIVEFSTVTELSQIISDDERFTQCLSQRLASYAYSKMSHNMSIEIIDYLNQYLIAKKGDMKQLFLEIAKIGSPKLVGEDL
ncbi:DUF1588 domain-containing protein [Pseudobacteriovorax antillogorgiicola]|uniref:DUF1592 domain-containing protein n=1 Tax=Pseudobacteriovorax antillogorgiicola TaxID=1513793 RepID=A0A1Y6CJ87_9BACT|nr:DUF1588 domain-containing protein [Pseudobacteriovorax antillogorgiicola]TCS46343.1 uncharacterized protein DUF1585 [Pseudobacteriovorax antillogorgiicola]SMF68057.1 Protein of unknown function [Pseudobacteriovorax antillogorgiicola]